MKTKEEIQAFIYSKLVDRADVDDICEIKPSFRVIVDIVAEAIFEVNKKATLAAENTVVQAADLEKYSQNTASNFPLSSYDALNAITHFIYKLETRTDKTEVWLDFVIAKNMLYEARDDGRLLLEDFSKSMTMLTAAMFRFKRDYPELVLKDY